MGSVTIPTNEDAEYSVLGAMLRSASARDAVREYVVGEDFYHNDSTLFDTILELHDKGIDVDAVSLHAELETRGQLAKVGGKARIHQLAQIVTATSNAAHHAKIIRELSVQRALINAGITISKLAESPGTTDELIHNAEQALLAATVRSGNSSFEPITAGFSDYVAQVRESYVTGIAKTGELTGFDKLDAILGGHWPGQLIIYAARPGQGKSTLALNVAENLVDRDIAVLIISLEMTRDELQERSLARAAKVDSYKLRSGQMLEQEAKRLAPAIEVVESRTKLLVNHDGYITLAGIKAEATRAKRQHDIGLMIVDYLQLITPPQAENRSIEISIISRGLKQLAKRLDIPIIAVSQMNRAIDARQNKTPQLSDLRDSGSLEQDADVVIFLHDETDEVSADGISVIVAKNRKGRKDTVKLNYIGRYSSFYNTKPREEDAE